LIRSEGLNSSRYSSWRLPYFARRLTLANGHPRYVDDTLPIGPSRTDTQSKDQDPAPSSSQRGPTWAPAIMLVDEIDLHLHPSWQQRDSSLVRSRARFIVPPTCSPQVLSTVLAECIPVIRRWIRIMTVTSLQMRHQLVGHSSIAGHGPCVPYRK